VRTLKNAVEDARGVLAYFNGEQVTKTNCLPEILEAVRALEDAIDGALQRAAGGRVTTADRDAVRAGMTQLFDRWSQCDDRTQAMMIDLRIVFGQHLGVKFSAGGAPTELS
jgi:hypothetical protein